MIRLPIRCGWIITANNPVFSSEIARRTIRIRLDAKVDRPWTRDPKTFRHPDLLGWAKENRGMLIWAVLTMAEAWIVEGCPAPEGLPTLGMFEDWIRVIGGILQVAGIPGFLGNLDEFYEESDAESTTLRTFIHMWWEEYGQNEVGVSELYNLIEKNDFPFDLGRGKTDRSQRTHLGMFLCTLRDRQFDNYRVVRGRQRKRAQQWKLIPTHIQPVETNGWFTQVHPQVQPQKVTSDKALVKVDEPFEPFSHPNGYKSSQDNHSKQQYKKGEGFGSPGSQLDCQNSLNNQQKQPVVQDERKGEPIKEGSSAEEEWEEGWI